jgi:hypothetical protein
MLFLLGMLFGTVAGCLICIRYLRRIQLQLDNLETAVNLGMVTRYADMAGGLQRLPVPPNAVMAPRSRAPEPPFAA